MKNKIKFSEITGHLTKVSEGSYKHLNPPLLVTFERWADDYTYIDGQPFNVTYGIFLDMLGQIYRVLPKDIKFIREETI
jgi:hypothetical protein